MEDVTSGKSFPKDLTTDRRYPERRVTKPNLIHVSLTVVLTSLYGLVTPLSPVTDSCGRETGAKGETGRLEQVSCRLTVDRTLLNGRHLTSVRETQRKKDGKPG